MTPHPQFPFTLSGSPYRDHFEMRGAPLQPDDLFETLDLTCPGLETVRTAVEAGDRAFNHAQAAQALLDYFRARRSVAWPAWVERAGLQATDEDFVAADNALRHIFRPYHAFPATDYGPDIDWDWDPHGNIEWPAHMHRMASWDLSAARCYLKTGDARYAELWVGLTWDWIRKNPLTPARCHFPQSWDAIQVGIRATRWSALLPCFLSSPACVPEFLVAFLAAIYNHARKTWLSPYPNQTDNFLVIESAGLADIALSFPEFKDAAQWRAAAFGQLDKAMRAQVLPDGMHGELSPGYHLYCASLFLNTADHAARNGYAAPFIAGVERMADVVMGIVTPQRWLPVVGDAYPSDARPFLRDAAEAFKRADFLAAATNGAQGQWPARRNFAFAHSGFYAFRSDWSAEAVWMCLHCGPASVQPSAFHSQFDNGTFELMAGGRYLMRDPGVYCYARGDPRREAFRRTAAHQTLTLNGANSRRAGRLLRWVEDDGRGNSALIVQNDSYPGLIHRRAVFFIQRRYFVLIDDALPTETPAGGAIDLHFQFAPGPVVIDPPARTARTAYTDGVNLLVWIDPRAPVTMEIEEAWFSPEHNQKEPMPAFRLRHAATQPPARFVTALIPWQDAPLPAVSVTVLETATGDDFAGARAQLRVNEALFEVG